MLELAIGDWSLGEARHLLCRAGFGGSPGEVARVHEMGREGAVDFLLNPDETLDAFDVPVWADTAVAGRARREYYGQKKELEANKEGLEEDAVRVKLRGLQAVFLRERKVQEREGQSWWFERILKTEAPLREKMVLFWHDHFPSSLKKVKFPDFLMGQNFLFREYAFGSFKELTRAVVMDPAMMLYLDTQQSSKSRPNENFARELLELFTLGEGEYTEEDVKEVARAFTGYKLERESGEVLVKGAAQDRGEKVIFGERGNFEGMDVVDLIFEREVCAEFLVRKLWVYFCYDEPGVDVVRELGKVFRDGGYEVGLVLREIFLSGEFYGERVMGGQIKCPVQYLVQMLKELEMDEVPGEFSLVGQVELGQELFMPPNVAGWDWGKAWVSTSTLLTRYNLAGQLVKGGFGGSGKDGEGKNMKRFFKGRRVGVSYDGRAPDFEKVLGVADRMDTERVVAILMERFFSGPVSEGARRSFMDYAEAKGGQGFTDEEVGELCHLMMSTPYYQLC